MFLSNFFTIPDICKSILAQPCLILIPYLIGKPLLFFLRKILSIIKRQDIVVELVVTWAFGVIFIMVVEILFYSIYLFFISSFVIILLFVGSFSIFIRENSKFDNVKLRDLFISAIYGLLFSIIVTLFWNYPYSSANDYIVHSYAALKIVRDNHPYIFGFFYIPTMQTLYAILLKLFNINNEPLYLLWSSRFIFYPIYVIGLFLFLNTLFKKVCLSLNISILGSSLIYSYGGSIFTWDVAPMNIVSILYVYLLYVLLKFSKDSEIKNLMPFALKLGALQILFFVTLYYTNEIGIIGYEVGLLLLFMLFLIPLFLKTINHEERSFFLSLAILLVTLEFFHKFMGLIAGVIVLTFFFILSYFKYLSVTAYRLLTSIGVLFTATIFTLFNFKVIPYTIKPPTILLESSSSFLFGWDSLVMFIKSVYPPILIFLIVVSYIIAIVIGKNKEILATSLIASLVVLAYFFPINSSWRLMMFAHPFLLSILGYSLLMLFETHRYTSKKTQLIITLFKTHRYTTKKTQLIIIIIIFNSIIGMSIYIHDMQEFEKSILNKKQQRNQLFQIGGFIKDNIKKDTILVGHIEWPYNLYASYGQIDFIYLWDKGEYNNSIIKNILLAKSSKEAYDKLNMLLKEKKYFVISPDKDGKDIERFYKKPSDLILIYSDMHAASLGDRNSVAKFFDPIYFEIVFKTTNMNGQNFYIIMLNKEIKTGYQNLLENPSFECVEK